MSNEAIQRGDGEMEFRILGPIEVRDGDRVLTPSAARQRALLGILLLHTGETVPDGVLVDAVWGDAPPQRPAAALRTLVQGLRRALEPGRARAAASFLVADDAGVRLCVDPATVDLCRFERLTAESRELAGSDPMRASALLREAASLWHGPALTGAGLVGRALDEAARLNRLRLDAIADRIQADLGMGRHATLVPELEALVAAHPQSERLLALLMLALHRCGRPQAALSAGANARQRLEPGPELESLERAIRDRDPELDGPPTPSSLTVVGMPVAAAPAAPVEEPAVAEQPSADGGRATVVTPLVAAAGRRRRSPAVLAGAAAFLVGSLGGVAIHQLRASAGTATPPAATAFPDAEEQQLVRQLGSAVGGCYRYPDHYAKALGEVECPVRPDHPGASSVVVQSFATYNDMEVHFHHVLSLTVQSETGRQVTAARHGRCDEPGAEFFTLSSYRSTAPGQSTGPRGHLLCYLDHTGVPRLAWTDIQRLTVSQAVGVAGAQDQTKTGLLGFWRSLDSAEEITPNAATPALPVATDAATPTATLAAAVVPDPLAASPALGHAAPGTVPSTRPTPAPTPAATLAATAHPAAASGSHAGAHSRGHAGGSDGWDAFGDLFDHGDNDGHTRDHAHD